MTNRAIQAGRPLGTTSSSADVVFTLPIGSMRYAGMLDGAGLANQAIMWSKGYAVAEALDADLISLQALTSTHDFARQLGLEPPVRTLTLALGNWLRRPRRIWILPHDVIRGDPSLLADRVRQVRCEQGKEPLWIGVPPNLNGLFAPGRSGLARLRTSLLPRLRNDDVTMSRGLVNIAVHLRAGDFSTAPEHVTPGSVNQRWPVSWALERVVAAILAAGEVDRTPVVRIVSDDSTIADRFRSALIDRVGKQCDVPAGNGGRPHVARDLAILSHADYLVPSGSTFSVLGLILGRAIYCWHLGHLRQAGPVGYFTGPFCADADAYLPMTETHQTGRLLSRSIAVAGKVSKEEVDHIAHRLRSGSEVPAEEESPSLCSGGRALIVASGPEGSSVCSEDPR